MGQSKCLKLDGYDIRSHSNDHPPPHVHIERPGEWAVRVFLRTTTLTRLDYEPLKRSRGVCPTGAQQKLLRERIVPLRAELIREWEIATGRAKDP
jgi:hypothetical protein